MSEMIFPSSSPGAEDHRRNWVFTLKSLIAKDARIGRLRPLGSLVSAFRLSYFDPLLTKCGLCRKTFGFVPRHDASWVFERAF
jgi:hypothetical protein